MPDDPRRRERFLDSEEALDSVKLTAGEREAMRRIGGLVAAADSLDEILNILFEEASVLIPSDRLCLAFLEDEGRRAVVSNVCAGYGPLLLDRGYADEIGDSLNSVFSTGKPRVISDLREYLYNNPESNSTSLLVREGMNSSMVCPLTIGDRRVGLLFRNSRQHEAYGDRELALHMQIADHLGFAIEKAWRIEQLAEANNAYLELLSFVSRELKNPLGSIIMDGRTLVDGFLGELSGDQKACLEEIIVKADYLLGFVRDYLDLARIESGELEVSSGQIDFVGSVIEPAISEVEGEIAKKGMELDLDVPDEGIEAECDAGLMRIVLGNLLSNAVIYGNDGGNIVVHAAKTESNLVVSVWNEGHGFSEKEQTRLFRKFTRLAPHRRVTLKRGTGVGLYVCWRIVGLHDGRIWARSELGRWAEFSLKIPQPLH